MCYIYEEDRKKLDPKAQPGVFLGYSSNCNAYVAGILKANGKMKTMLTRSIKFDEDKYFFKERHGEDITQPVTTTDDETHIELGMDIGARDAQVDIQVKATGGAREEQDALHDHGSGQEEPPAEPLEDRRPVRTRRLPTHHGDYVSWDQLDTQGEALISCMRYVIFANNRFSE